VGLLLLALVGCHDSKSRRPDLSAPRVVGETMDVGSLGLGPGESGTTIGLGPSPAPKR
jgi:hypothetical protein